MRRMFTKKVALALAAAVGSVGLFGAAALAAFAPPAPAATESVVDPAVSTVLAEDRPDKLKTILDALVQKGVITQQQEDAILAALRDAAPTKTKREAVLRDFMVTSAEYLGTTVKDLHAKLPGTSLAAIANSTPGKNRAGLVVALIAAANADLDKALASKRITEEQAKKLRDDLANRVNTFVDRTWPAKRTTDRGASLKSFLGDMLQTSRDYLGLSLEQVTTQLRAGKSLGEIADATPGKNRAGLIAALTAVAMTHIDRAVTEKKITPEQATALKAKVGAEVTSFVDRKLTTKSVNTTRTIKRP